MDLKWPRVARRSSVSLVRTRPLSKSVLTNQKKRRQRMLFCRNSISLLSHFSFVIHIHCKCCIAYPNSKKVIAAYFTHDAPVMLSCVSISWTFTSDASLLLLQVVRPSWLCPSVTSSCQRSTPHPQSCWISSHCLSQPWETKPLRPSTATNSPTSTPYKHKVRD